MARTTCRLRAGFGCRCRRCVSGRRRFACDRLDGLVDEPRPGKPRTVSDDRVEEIIVKTLESAKPKGGTHWSTREMARVAGITQPTVRRVWRAFGLKPHRARALEAVQGPVVHREGQGHGWALSGSSRAGSGGVRGREDRDPSVRSHRADVANACRARRSGRRTITNEMARPSLFAALEVTTGQVIRPASLPPSRDRVQEVPRRRSTTLRPPSSMCT